MAATLSSDQQELAYFSFPIEKQEETAETNPVDGTPDILIWGKATDGTIDGDGEIVDPEWSAKAIQEWADTGGNVRMGHDPKRPVGSSREVQVSTDGHWVKSLICDPLAKHFIRQGVLNDYSVGISNPEFRHRDPKLDPQGKALRIITGRPDGLSRIVELSVVDRGSNFNSRFQIVRKSAGDGPEFTGAMIGPDEEIAPVRAMVEKSVTVSLPSDVSVSFSPSDLAKLLEHRRVAEDRAEKRDMDPGTGGGVDRDKIPAEDFAGKNRSFPIVIPKDVRDASLSVGRAGDDNYPPDELKSNIISIAKRKGPEFEAELPDSWKDGGSAKAATPEGGKKCDLCKGKGKIRGGELTCPRCHGDGMIAGGEPDEHGDSQDKAIEPEAVKAGARDCPGCGKGHDADSPAKFCADCGKKLPAVSKAAQEPDEAKAGGTMDDDAGGGEQDSDGQDDSSDDADEDDDDAKPGSGDSSKAAAPAMAKKPKVPCPGCGKGVKAKMAFCPGCGGSMKPPASKASKPTPGDGVTGEHVQPVPAHREPDGPAIESLEHDAQLPTDPDGPYLRGTAKSASARIDALGIPYPLGAMHDLLCPAYAPGTAAKAHPEWTLADTDLGDWMDKALSAAAGAPLEEAAAAQLLWQHAAVIKALPAETLAEAASDFHKSFTDANPGPGTFPVPGEISATRFRRPYLTAGHAAPSPQQDGPNTASIPPSGGITATDYTRGYLDAGHAADSPSNKADGGAPPAPGASNGSRVFYRNTARDGAKAAMQAMHDHIAQTFPDLCPMKEDPHSAPMPEPGPLPRPAGAAKAAEAATAPEQPEPQPEAVATAPEPEAVAKAMGASAPDLVKALAEVMSPVLAELTATRGQLAEAQELLKAQGETLAAQNATLATHGEVLDAIAGQPDPNGPHRGAPLQAGLAKAAVPAPLSPAQSSERAQLMVYDELHRTWRDSPDPTARLAAEQAMARMRGLPGAG